MNQNRFQLIDLIFDEVLEVPTLERENFLNQRCKNDEELKKEVLALVSAVGKSAEFIEKPLFAPVKSFLNEESNNHLIGKKLGVYQITELIGKGGNGVVYLAKRIDDFEKEVAIKIIPNFETSKYSTENFRRERQILARLEHPNIAQILDGGTTTENIPYLVMEYVDGLPLNVFCEDNNLSINEKLTLFQDVCQAVSFAHQNLVVHRDLKPNNILVTKDGKVKLLDFGIAKLLQTDDLASNESKTIEGNALTPEYASPEQINGENITTASDVYSLGVVLYELLTGKRPFDFRGKPLSQILKIAQEKEAPAPSIIQDSRFKIQDSELDAVILKALTKSPLERYQTVEEFRTDIHNYLNNLPILARPQTNFYRFSKYLKRHKAESIIGAFIIAILLGWFITANLQTQQAEKQARENLQQAYSAEMILAANEYEHANLNQLQELLEKYIPKENEEDLRGFEWYFLNNLLNPSSKIGSLKENEEVWNTEFSPDGKFLATVVNDNSVNVWNLETKEKIASSNQKGAWKVSFFPDGNRLAVAGSSNSEPIARIYETSSLKEVLTLSGHSKRVRAVDVSPTGKIIATGSADGHLIIWNAETGEEIKRFFFGTEQDIPEIFDLQFSKDGKKLVVSAFEYLAVFDTQTWHRKEIDINDFIDKNVNLQPWKVIFSPLEKTLALGTFSGDIVILDAETLKILRVLKVHQANVKSLDFSSDGKILATGSWDRTVKFIDVQTGEIVNELRGHFAGIHELVFSPDNKIIVTAGGDLRVNLWDSKSVLDSNSIPTTSSIATIAESIKQIITWDNGNFDLTSWDLITRKKTWTHKINASPFSIAYNPQNNYLYLGKRNGFISIYDAQNGKEIRQTKSFDTTIYTTVISPDGKKLYLADEQGFIKSLNVENLEENYSIKAHSNITKTLDISPDGKILASGNNDKFIKLFNAETGEELITLSGNTKPLYKVTFSNDGKFLASSGADDIARIWQVSDGKLVYKFSGMSGGVFALAFSPDGKRLATSSDLGIIRLWNTETGSQVLAFSASQRIINQLWFSKDGNTLMSYDMSGKLSFWQSQ